MSRTENITVRCFWKNVVYEICTIYRMLVSIQKSLESTSFKGEDLGELRDYYGNLLLYIHCNRKMELYFIRQPA